MKGLPLKGLPAVPLLVFCLFSTLPLAAGGGEAGEDLVVENSHTGRTWTLPLAGVKEIAFRFFHSYDRQWVSESFRIEQGRFVPICVLYQDDSYDYRHQRYRCRTELGPRGVRLTHIRPTPADRLPRIVFRVAHGPRQVLVLRKEEGDVLFPFSVWGLPGERLVVSVRDPSP